MKTETCKLYSKSFEYSAKCHQNRSL